MIEWERKEEISAAQHSTAPVQDKTFKKAITMTEKPNQNTKNVKLLDHNIMMS